MSVQVRRRREAAAFLATFVGAQGELLVDTTNNRVQVHDGATPGGWPAARLVDVGGKNLIVNGNFAINQRAYASGGSIPTNGFGHDRWKNANQDNISYTFSQANFAENSASNSIDTIVNASSNLRQIIEKQNIAGGAYTLSWQGTALANVSWFDGSNLQNPVTQAASPVTFALPKGVTTLVDIGGGSVTCIQLEAGSIATLFERRPASIEMIRCQRYYEVINAGLRASQASGNISIPLPFKVTKRAVPTIVFTDGSYYSAAGKFNSSYTTIDNATINFNNCGANTDYFNFFFTVTANAEI